MSDDRDKNNMALNRERLPENQTPRSENVYENIHETLQALDDVTIDGCSSAPLPTSLLANSFKQLIPETETGMILSGALPMSDADIESIKIKKELEHSLESIKAKVSCTSRTLKDISGPRIRIAYRLCRYMSHLIGHGQIGKPSIFSMAGNVPDLNTYEFPMPYDPMRGLRRGMSTPRMMIEDITNSQYEYTFMIDDALFKGQGMSILPPPLHDGYYPDPPFLYRKEMYTPPDYDPKTDVPLSYYLNIMEYLVNYLEIGNSMGGGSFTGVEQGSIDKKPRSQNIEDRSAVLALLNPSIARLAWPCRDDLETFEEYVLIPYIEDILVKNSLIHATDIVKETMGLTHPEAFDYIEVAKTYARDAHNYDIDSERSILISKLDNLSDRCGSAGMVSTELKSIMSKARILGLTKHIEDTNIDKREGLKLALEEKINSGKILNAGDFEE